MSLSLSNRARLMVQSEIRNMSIECELAGGINLSQGVCDLEVPRVVREGAREAIDAGTNCYTRYDGIRELREAIARKATTFNGLRVDPEQNVIVTGGATGALYAACLALLNAGDEVILFEPYYGYHVNTLLAVDAVPVYVSLRPPGWEFNARDLDEVVTARTKGIIINTPANPCGKVFSRQELEALAEFSVRHDLFVFTDEIYEYFLYDDLNHVSPGSMESIADRTITISGYSKTFSITGWRLGYVICDAKWARMIGYVSDLVYVCAPAPLQVGVAKGILELPDDYYTRLCAQYCQKRDMLCSALSEAGMAPFVPQGAYYVLADVAGLPGTTPKEKALGLLKATGVASVPGNAFYHDEAGDNLLRFCFAKSEEVICEASDRLRNR